jgi:pimeloyl-ACP methyl ester carboxylesterase
MPTFIIRPARGAGLMPREGGAMKQIVRYKSGNSLSYADYGDRNGYPILVQHGLIASITDFHLFDRLIESGARLLCVARPGYGESSPNIMRNMAEWADIASVLADELELPHFDVLGMSSGAPYSYALGHKFPGRVRNIFIFSGTPALYDDQILALWPYPVNKKASLAELEELAQALFFSHLPEEALLSDDIRDSMMNHGFGIAQDLKLRCVDWGFSLSEVKNTVYMQHGELDPQVPFITAEMTAKLLPDCRFEARKSEGHFSKELLDDFIKNTVVRHLA